MTKFLMTAVAIVASLLIPATAHAADKSDCVTQFEYNVVKPHLGSWTRWQVDHIFGATGERTRLLVFGKQVEYRSYNWCGSNKHVFIEYMSNQNYRDGKWISR